MRPVLNRSQIRAFDECATTGCAVPSLLLMENAGRGAADYIVAQGHAERGVLVLCGPGNNGGDGWVVARRLLSLGHAVEVVSIVDTARLDGDAALMFAAYRGCGGGFRVIQDASALFDSGFAAGVVVDALFGTGLTRPVEGLAAAVIQRINQAALPVIALDIVSGLDADTGSIQGVCVQAAATLTFAHPKLGHYTPSGQRFGGALHVLDIGVPGKLFERVGHSALCLDREDISQALRRIPVAHHKGEAGRILVVAGSAGSSGAARLVAHGALRAGAGLVTIAARPDVAEALEQTAWEAQVRRIDVERPRESIAAHLSASDAVAIGSGLGLDSVGREITRQLVLEHPGKLVVDADALTHFSGGAAELARAAGVLMLTPHPAEAARLLGVTTAEVQADRFKAVRTLADLTQSTVLLKGACTLVCEPGSLPQVIARGASTLATAGSGDVLAGVVAAFACHTSPSQALTAGAWVHALAGEQLALGGLRGALAREIGDAIPAAIVQVSRS
jgi:ADP-dependent NAD(P)H-hydrate dehydratase / NAD(P)H-hydrate epimerase